MAGTPSIYASTACVKTSKPLEEHIKDYTAAGLQNIELGAAGPVSQKDLDAVIANESVSFLVHNYFPPPPESFVLNLSSPSASVRQQSLDQVARALEFSARIGAPFYSVHGGFLTDPNGFAGISFTFPELVAPDAHERAMDRYAEALGSALQLADKFETDLIVENNYCPRDLVGKLLFAGPSDFVDLFERISHSRLGVLMDSGHLNVSASAMGFDRLSFPRALKEHIRAVHLHDNDGVTDLHLPASEGSWTMDVLRELDSPTIIVEAKFPSVAELASYVDSLQETLTQDSDAQQSRKLAQS